MNKMQIVLSGILKNNPTFVLVLGMCPTLGTTTSAINGMGILQYTAQYNLHLIHFRLLSGH